MARTRRRSLLDLRPLSPDICERCNTGDHVRVIESDGLDEYRRRRYKCSKCGDRWNGYETRIHPRRITIHPSHPVGKGPISRTFPKN